ncbi:MAG: tetratricopeptide repeat protein [Desulfobacterales bacterium]|nr:tetratricopeptide repeat protein [Desulfobacterales bacterium]
MKDDAKGSCPDQKGAREFLRKATDSGAPTSAGSEPPPHTPVQTDSAFAEKGAAAVAGLSAFFAMVICLDSATNPEPDPTEVSRNALRDHVASVIDACCREQNGIWGLLEADLFACILPHLTPAAGKAMAEAIRDAVAQRQNGTVSIGTAVFPQGEFQKDEIIDNALKALDHAAFFGPGAVAAFDAVSLNISGDKHYQAGDISSAIEEFQRALALDPKDYNVQNSLGVCYGVLGAYEKALKIFEAAMILAPDDTMAIYNAGLTHVCMGDRDRALDLFLQAAKTQGAPYEVGLQAGRIYLDMKEPTQAHPFLEIASESQPESGIAHRYLGECLAALDRVEPAVAAYKKAVRFNPHDAEALSAMGCLFDRMGENPEISTLFCRQSIELAPENGLFRQRLGDLLLKQNRLEEALEHFFAAEERGIDVRDLIAETRERLTLEAS